jgi:hypothetical protein
MLARSGVAAVALLLCCASAAAVRVPPLDHVVVVVFENKAPSEVNAHTAPTFTRLGRRYVRLTRYFGVAHPSLPNYLALVSGQTYGIHSNCTDCSVSGPNLGNELSDAGRTWAAYAEGYPSSPLFAKRHVPFLYYRGGAAHVHPLSKLDVHSLPDFALVVPDTCNDMHDCSVRRGDAWLRRFVEPLLALPRTVVFVIFDEGVTDERGGGRTPALALGTAVRSGAVVRATIDHYGLLRTIEDAWSLPRLNRSAEAPALTGIWR